MMRILQLGKFYPIIGGVEKVMVDLLKGLSLHGVSCDMLCCNAEVGKPKVIIDIAPNAQLICVKAGLKKFSTMISFQMITELRRICHDYDIIHIHQPDPMATLALLLSGYTGKVVVHWHSDILSQKALLLFYLPLQSWLLNRANAIVGTTPIYIKESPFLRNFQSKCTYLPIGIHPVVWNDTKVEEIRSRYPQKHIIFSLGRLVYYKGFEYLIDAARNLPDNYVVLIGGSGELRKDLQNRIETHGLQDKVILLGRISDESLPNYFRACDIFCLSSILKTEAFAIVQIEAMSCGKPIVATLIPGSGVSWVNAEGVSGVNVPIADSDALAKAFKMILEDEKRREQLAKGAKQRFQTVFLFENMINKCIEIYRSLL